VPPSTWGQGPPSVVAEAPTAAGTPFWVLALFGLGAGVCLVIGLLFLIPLFGSDPDTRQSALFFTIPAILLAVLQGIALLGLYLRQSWGRGLGFVAAGALCLTIVGALLGGPLIYGLINTRTAD
jgi:hypothetical protein